MSFGSATETHGVAGDHDNPGSTSGSWPTVADNRSSGLRCIWDVDGGGRAAGRWPEAAQTSIRGSLHCAGRHRNLHGRGRDGRGEEWLRQVDIYASERFVTEWLEN